MVRRISLAMLFVVACSSGNESAGSVVGAAGDSGAAGSGAAATGGASNAGSGGVPNTGGLPSGGNAGASGAGATGGSAGSGGSSATAGASGSAGNSGSAGSSGSAGASGSGGTGGMPLPTCACLYGNGTYCGAGVVTDAQQNNCQVELATQHTGDVLRCTDGNWTLDQTCDVGCFVAPPGQPDGCNSPQPTCDCYYGNGAYCGAGVQAEASTRGCTVDVANQHPDDILQCTNGAWSVSQDCSTSCLVAPPGQADVCNTPVSDGQYRVPWDCGQNFTCTQGNFGDTCGGGTGSHTDKQQYAFDFGLPRHTQVVAARAGTVVFSDNIVGPGDNCYDGCSSAACCSACLNTVNRVVIRHSDGTTALYLHLDQATATVGSNVNAGDPLGWSGISGCSFGAHLHFQVQQDCGIWFCNSLPIEFVEASPMACGVSASSQNGCP